MKEVTLANSRAKKAAQKTCERTEGDDAGEKTASRIDQVVKPLQNMMMN